MNIIHHNEHWNALEGDSAKTWNRVVPEMIQHGKSPCVTRDGLNCIRHGEGPLQFQAVCRAGTVKSAFPYCAEGRINSIRVDQVIPSPDGYGGIISGASLGGAAIEFFDVDFCQNRNRYVIGERYDFEVAAIAYWMEPAAFPEIVLDNGPLVEFERTDALLKNPTADVSEIKKVELCTEGFRGIFANRSVRDDATVYSVVESVECFESAGTAWYCVEATLMLPDEIPFKAKVFASRFALKEYRPKPGDAFTADLWLQGRLTAHGSR